MNEQELLARCSSAVGGSSTTFPSIESLNGFFQLLRPAGEKLDRVLFGSEAAVDVRRRIQSIFDATKSSWDGLDAYFVVRKPAELRDTDAIAIASRHLTECARVATASQHEWLLSFLAVPPSIKVVRTIEASNVGEFSDALVDAVGNFVDTLVPSEREWLMPARGSLLYGV